MGINTGNRTIREEQGPGQNPCCSPSTPGHCPDPPPWESRVRWRRHGLRDRLRRPAFSSCLHLRLPTPKRFPAPDHPSPNSFSESWFRRTCGAMAARDCQGAPEKYLRDRRRLLAQLGLGVGDTSRAGHTHSSKRRGPRAGRENALWKLTALVAKRGAALQCFG